MSPQWNHKKIVIAQGEQNNHFPVFARRMREPVFAVLACRRARQAGKQYDAAVVTVVSNEGNGQIFNLTGGKKAGVAIQSCGSGSDVLEFTVQAEQRHERKW